MPEAERVKALALMGLDADAIPLNATAAERTAAMDPGLPAIPPPVSPTGKPLVPASWVPYLTIAASVFGFVALAPTFGLSMIPAAVVGGAAALSTISLVLLGASPGLRKPPQ